MNPTGGGGDGQQYGGPRNPWEQPRDGGPGAVAPRPGGSPVVKVLVVLGILGVLGAGTCAACGFFLYSQFSDMFGQQVVAALEGNEVFDEHIGEVHEISIDLMATGEEDASDVFVFRVEGSRGSGRLVVQTLTVDDETEEVLSGRIELSDGSVFDLFPEGRAGGGLGAKK
jgi:hypothetical protein